MTQSLRWWILAEVLLLVALGAWMLPPPEIGENDGRPWVRAFVVEVSRPGRDEAGTARRRVQDKIAEWAVDRSREALRREPPRDVAVTVLGGPDTLLARLGTEVATQFWNLVPAGPQPVRLRVTLMVPTAEAVPGAPLSMMNQTIMLPPPAMDGSTCLLILGPSTYERFGGPADKLRRDLARRLRQAAGPCALWKAFGRPGPGIAAWLGQTGYHLAMSGNWGTGAREVGLNAPGLNWAVVLDDSPTARMMEDFGRRLVGEPNPIYFLGRNGARCMAGRSEGCTQALLTPRRFQRGASYLRVSAFEWNDPLGDAGDRFLSDLIEARGRETFARFWQSPDAPAVAFHAAYGDSLGTYTAGWMRRTYGEFASGTSLPPLTVLSALVVALAMVALTLWVVRHRTMG